MNSLYAGPTAPKGESGCSHRLRPTSPMEVGAAYGCALPTVVGKHCHSSAPPWGGCVQPWLHPSTVTQKK